jgi:hypothetical protein
MSVISLITGDLKYFIRPGIRYFKHVDTDAIATIDRRKSFPASPKSKMISQKDEKVMVNSRVEDK